MLVVYAKWSPENIRALRQTLGLSQHQFANRIGASSHSQISNWEKARYRPSLKYIERLEALEHNLLNPGD